MSNTFLSKNGLRIFWAQIINKFIDKNSIINNLTTEDSTKVLSASQGPIIQSALQNLENRVGNLDVITNSQIDEVCVIEE